MLDEQGPGSDSRVVKPIDADNGGDAPTIFPAGQTPQPIAHRDKISRSGEPLTSTKGYMENYSQSSHFEIWDVWDFQM